MRRLLLPLALVAAVLVACGSDNPDAGGTPLVGTTWEIVPGSLGSTAAQPTLRLEPGDAFGNAGCNTFRGPYTLKPASLGSGPTLEFGELATTQMACPPDQTAVEQLYLSRLARVRTYQLTPAGLQLDDATGRKLLVYNAANSSLVGDWKINAYLTADGNAFSSVVVGSSPTITFVNGGTFTGTTGCNTFKGSWKQGPLESLTITGVAATLVACTDAQLADQDKSILAALEASVRADVATHQASFFNSAGQRTLELFR